MTNKEKLIEKRNDELEKELAAKNRELEIEAALEKVRTVAMSMKTRADMLEICRSISHQLQSLNVKEIRNVQTALFYQEKGVYMNYEYYAKHDKTFITETSYTNNEIHQAFADQMLKGNGQVFITHIKGDEVKDWIAYQKTTNVFIDDYLYTASSLNYYWYSLGAVALGISTYEPLTEEEKNLFHRFLKVFELAYRRHRDIEEAEAQAREAKIQLALERVRARTMAMQKSDELSEAALLLFEQVQSLGITLWSCGFNIWEIEDKECTSFVTRGGKMLAPLKLPLTENPLLRLFIESRQQGLDFWHMEMFKEENEDLYRYIALQRAKNNTGDNQFLTGITLPDFQIVHLAGFSHGNLMFITTEPCPEMHDVFKRFGKVFEQTYTRFLDLQKAEAQAREAHIEAALEKVRSRSLAVHKSDEFKEVIQVVFERLQELGFQATSVSINIFIKDSNDTDVYICGQGESGQFISHFRLPYFDSLISNDRLSAQKNNLDFFTKTYSSEEKNQFYDLAFELSDLKLLPDEIKKMVYESERYTISLALAKNSMIVVNDFAGKVLSENEIDVVKRFSRVFEQAYIRYLDLQKVEAQAKEAQIELGLERVRARAMAMHSSEELNSLAGTLFNELTRLDFILVRCLIIIIDAETGASRWFMANPEDLLNPIDCFVKYHENPGYLAVLKAWRERTPKWVYINEGQLKKEWGEFLLSETELASLPDSVKKGMTANERVFLNFSFGNFGGFLLSTVEPLPVEKSDILFRFAKVFEQTYTRFLDLQKAEAQAREAQVEAALEKVRSRSLAMHKSDELKDVVSLVFEKLRDLNVTMDSACILTFTEGTYAYTAWAANPDLFSVTSARIPVFDDPIERTIREARSKGRDFISQTWTFEEKNNHWEYLFEHSDWKHMPEYLKKAIREFEGWGFTGPVTKNSATLLVSYSAKKFSEQENEIIKRFGKVFDQAYIRFLDLQKAEAQARESQIQLALERVRARTMAMQRSEELSETAYILFQQFKELGEDPFQITIGIFNEDEQVIEFWATGIDGTGLKIDRSYKLSIDEPALLHKMYAAWKEQKKSTVIELKGDELYAWIEFRKGATGLPEPPVIAGINDRRFVSVGFFSKGLISISRANTIEEETTRLAERFAVAFDLAYTRFVDLKKAEAQSREAQIQLALERVRARTMAMQRSDELKDAAALLFQQAKALGVPAYSCGYNIWEKNEKEFTSWMSTQDGSDFNAVLNIPLTEDANFIRYAESRQKGEQFFVLELRAERMQEHYQYLKTIPAFREWFDHAKKMGFDLPETQIHHIANFSHGNLLFITLEPCPGFHDVFKRFARVFEQTYTRFLDLQKAEAQAREAQIEAALERVRSRTMAMHQSGEIADIAGKIFKELSQLDLVLNRVLIWIFNDAQRYIVWWSANPELPSNAESYRIDYNDQPVFHSYLQAWQARTPLHLYTLEGDAKKKWEDHLFANTELSKLPIEVKRGMREEGTIYTTSTISDYGLMMVGSFEPLSNDNIDIIQRFGRVFQQSYTRYLDVQTAEAQVRESQIQLALERVRARTMAMQHSNELKSAATLLFQQAKTLGVPAYSCGYNIWEENEKVFTSWMSTQDGTDINAVLNIPLTEDANFIRFDESRKKGESFFVLELRGERMQEHYRYLKTIPAFKEYFDYAVSVGFALPETQIHHIANFSHGNLLFITLEPCPEFHHIFKRFAAVFNQTYTRFLDLQKAEAQAREAQIEAALERVRSKTMAMHNSADVGETVATMFDELLKLGIETLRCGIGIMMDDNKMEVWTAKSETGEKVDLVIGRLDMTIHPLLQGAYSNWKNKKDYFSYELEGEDLITYYNAINNYSGYPIKYEIASLPGRIIHNDFFFAEGSLFVFSLEKLPAEPVKIFKRFSAVFGQTYKRYLDLQKAEAQARESQIQLALERVRARTMAMQRSDELIDTASILFKHVGELGVHSFASGVHLWNEDEKAVTIWSCTEGEMLPLFKLPVTEDPAMKHIYEAAQAGKNFHVEEMGGDELKEHYEYLFSFPDIKEIFGNLSEAGFPVPKFQIFHAAFFSHGYLLFITHEPCPEAHSIFIRFAKVFEQTYIRFLDLQKAEAQAREATIEAALERVRAKAMAMQKPDELIEVAQLLRKEMGLLGVEELETSSIYIHDEATGKTECWYAIMKENEQEKKLVSDHMTIDLNETWVGKQMLAFYSSAEKQISIAMKGVERKEWINYCADHSKVIVDFYGDAIPDRTYHLCKFSGGYMGAASPGNISAESWNLLQRATSVFSLAYTRFSDLIKSEANAKEAVKQAALDRIRADIASMRTVSDLDKITPLIWNELTILGIPFIRSGVFIMDDDQKLIHTFLSTPEGKAIAAFHISYSAPGNMQQVLNHWRRKKNYIDHWDKSAFTEFANTLVNQGGVVIAEQYLSTIPGGGFYLHFLPFLQGMLYVGNTTQLNDDEIRLLQSVADAFSTAYARYEDFNKLEAAKQQVDSTLNELRATQKQLIQSEKMASLGELTAGIAHEIQNPLNFVNNFSEVNSELIDELLNEKSKPGSDRNEELEIGILNDLKANEEKINHHGKRADAIVKGMLQHSRKSEGVKEPTDINALCDEYLRLSYHGMRAKDKSFNAEIKTGFDESIRKINIIPQDIGRVLINLFNNAFYAVNEKKKSHEPSAMNYEPLVSVQTKKLNDKIEIRITDNGNGIPQNIVDKIFQPFFTTKPTGEGTGLGLSLSYDIIKAHGGEIKVETREGEFTTFIIQLPNI